MLQPMSHSMTPPTWSGDPDECHPDNPFLFAQSHGPGLGALPMDLGTITSKGSPRGVANSQIPSLGESPQGYPSGSLGRPEEQVSRAVARGALDPQASPISLDTLRTKYQGVVDLGYLSFLLAKNLSVYDSKIRKVLRDGWLVAGEGGAQGEIPIRRQLYGDYKSRRKNRRAQLGREALDYRDRVHALRDLVAQDPWVDYMAEPLAEGDDLVALWAITVGGKAVGIDKDYLAVARASERGLLPAPVTFYTDLDADEFSITNWNGRHKLFSSQYVQALDDGSPGYWVMAQAFFGDKSDSVPRLVAGGEFMAIAKPCWTDLMRLLRDSTGWDGDYLNRILMAYRVRPIDLFRNLQLVLVPYPGFRQDPPRTLDAVLRLVLSGEYWSDTSAWLPFLERVLWASQTRSEGLRAMDSDDSDDFFRKR